MRGEAVQERARRVLANPTGVAAPGLIRLKPGDESAALFLFPGAGADVLELDPLGPTPGEPASRDVSVDAIVDRALEAITQAQPRGACHLLGYSFGGAIAVEAARRLGG